MALAKLTRTLKAKGYTSERSELFSAEHLAKVVYNEYHYNGIEALEIQRVKGEAARVTFIHEAVKAEMAEMGLTVGTIID